MKIQKLSLSRKARSPGLERSAIMGSNVEVGTPEGEKGTKKEVRNARRKRLDKRIGGVRIREPERQPQETRRDDSAPAPRKGRSAEDVSPVKSGRYRQLTTICLMVSLTAFLSTFSFGEEGDLLECEAQASKACEYSECIVDMAFRDDLLQKARDLLDLRLVTDGS